MFTCVHVFVCVRAFVCVRLYLGDLVLGVCYVCDLFLLLLSSTPKIATPSPSVESTEGVSQNLSPW